MSKLECGRCGHLILDVADDLPYKAFVVPDAGDLARREALSIALAELVAARDAGTRNRWFRKHFPHDPPAGATDDDLVFHLLANADGRVRRLMYECAECGALHLQERHGGLRFACYAPTDGAAPGILSPDGRRDG